MRSSRFLKSVVYLHRPACSRPFFSLPSSPVSLFGPLGNSTKDEDWRQNAVNHDEDEPEGNEDDVQRHHERKIMPCVATNRCPCSSTILTCCLLIDIVRRSCTIWLRMLRAIDISCHFVMRRRFSTRRGRIGSQTQEMDLRNWKQSSELGFWV
jgi:hypothetical protein